MMFQLDLAKTLAAHCSIFGIEIVFRGMTLVLAYSRRHTQFYNTQLQRKLPATQRKNYGDSMQRGIRVF